MQDRCNKKCRGKAPMQQPVSHLLSLGQDVINNVLVQLACTLEPGGIRGPSIVARDLASAAQVCKEFKVATQRGFDQLAELVYSQLQQQQGMPTHLSVVQQAIYMEYFRRHVPRPALNLLLLPPTSACGPLSVVALALEMVERAQNTGTLSVASSGSNSLSRNSNSSSSNDLHERLSKVKQTWAFWDAIVACPASISYGTLVEAALKIGLPLQTCRPTVLPGSEGSPLTHAELLQSVLQVFGITTATSVPAVVLAAVARERCSDSELVCDGPHMAIEMMKALRELAMLAREAYIPLGFKAQSWGYGQRRPPGWPPGTHVTQEYRGYAWQVKGGVAAIRRTLEAAGMESLQQLQQLVKRESVRVEKLKAEFAVQIDAAEPADATTKALRKSKIVSAIWRRDKKAAQRQKLAGQMSRFDQTLCSCGEVAAKRCARGSCAKCCIAAAIAALATKDESPPPPPQQQQQVTCVRHKVCKGCNNIEAAKHCVRDCCSHCCQRRLQQQVLQAHASSTEPRPTM